MTDIEQRAVLTIDLDTEKLTKQSAFLQKEVDRLTASQKQLRDEGKQGTVAYQKQETTLRGLKKELGSTKKQIDDNIKATKTQQGSNDQLRATLSILTKEYNSLSKEQRTNTKVGQDLGKQIKSVSDELKENESAIGDNRRNVGNYTSALSGMGGQLGKAIAAISTLTATAEANAAAMTGMAASSLTAGAAMGALRAGALKAVGAVKQLTVASLRFILTPIGAIIAAIALAVGSLVAFFSKSQAGIEKFDKATRVVSTVVDVFVDRIILLGSALFNLLTLDFSGFASDAKAAFSGVADEIIREVAAAAELEDQLKALERAENDQIITGEIRKAQIAELKLAAKDESKTLKEKIDSLSEARRLIDENIAVEQKLQEQRIAQILGITDEAKLRKVLNSVIEDGNQLALEEIGLSNSTEEDRKKANEEIANLIRLRKESADSQKEIASEQVGLIRQAAAEREKALKAEQDIIEKTRSAYQSLTQSFIDFERKQLTFIGISLKEQLKLLQRQQALELKILEDKFKKQEQELRKSGASEKAIREGLLNLQIQEQKELTLLIANSEQERLELETKAAKALSDARASILDEIHKGNLTADEQELLASQQKYDALYQQLVDAKLTEDEFLIAQAEIKAQQEKEFTALTKKQQEERTKKEKEEADKRRQIAQAELEAKIGLLQGLSEIVSEAAGEQTEAAKAIATASALASTFAAINKTMAEPALPFPTNVIQSAIIGGKGLINVAKIQKLEDGDMMEIGGRRHSAGGTKFFGEDGTKFEAERGEKLIVMNRNASAMINKLSDLNAMTGGKSFGSGASNYFQDGGIVERSVSSGVDRSVEINDLIQAVIDRPVQVSIQEIREVNNRVNVRESTGTF